MDFQKVPLTRSIGVELVKKIFGVYCIAAIIVTLFQMWLEYSQARDLVIASMIEHQPSVEKSMANAIWHLDLPLLNSLLDGILDQREITGVVVYHENGNVIAKKGNIAHNSLSQTLHSAAQTSTSELDNTYLYIHHFELFDPNDLSAAPIGSAIFTTSDDVVIDVIKPLLYAIFVAAIIKTVILWILFLYFGQKLLGRPLNNLIAITRKLPLKASYQITAAPKKGLNELEVFTLVLNHLENKLSHTLADLKESNEKLSNTNTQLLRAVEQSPTVSTILSTSGKVKYTTPSFSALTGFSTDQAQVLFDRYFINISFKWLVKQFETHKVTPELYVDESTIFDKNEQPIYLSTTFSPVYCDDGKVESFLCSANDISKLKQLELDLKQKNLEQQEAINKLNQTQKQLIQSEKMSSIGQLAAGIAHEINNPVGFINSNVDTLDIYLVNLFKLIKLYGKEAENLSDNFSEATKLREDIDFEFLAEDIPSMIAETKEGLNRVKTIIRNLMDFSRESDAELVSYDVREGLESTLNVAWHELKYKAEIIKEFDDIDKIECKPSQLNQVFMNLMVNAAQAIEKSGIITLRVKQEQQQIIIEIEDNGPGIKPKNLNKLFDPFFTTKPVGQGTGLGLSVSYGIINNHNGKITVDSKLGQGTCFHIYLPLEQPSRSRDSAI